MNQVITVLIGLIVGYVIGVGLAALSAFVFGFEDAARVIAIGCGLLGAVRAIPISERLQGRMP